MPESCVGKRRRSALFLDAEQTPPRLVVALLRPRLAVQQALERRRLDALAFKEKGVQALELLLPVLVRLAIRLARFVGRHVVSVERVGTGLVAGQ